MNKINPLFKTLYLLAYIFGVIIFIDVWLHHAPICIMYSCSGSFEEASGSAFLILAGYYFLLRLIKIATLYILVGKKPDWKKEFKNIF